MWKQRDWDKECKVLIYRRYKTSIGIKLKFIITIKVARIGKSLE
jgi:hypothetical protein